MNTTLNIDLFIQLYHVSSLQKTYQLFSDLVYFHKYLDACHLNKC